MQFTRRTLLKAVGASALAAPVARDATELVGRTGLRRDLRPASPASAWPGHQPGRIYLGAASHADDWERTLADLGDLGVHRTFYQWGLTNRERNTIRDDHKAMRLPWVSFKPPGGTWRSWDAIGEGRYDEDIRVRARFYAEFAHPIIVTFHHEPTDDAPSQGAGYSNAWSRIYDVMNDETSLQNIIYAPITSCWIFDPWNKKDDPAEWATPDVLDRCHFFGFDLYQQPSQRGYAERIGAVLDFLDSRGRNDLMVGIGETGATDDLPGKTGAEWWEEQWAWVEKNVNRIGVISYYNTVHPQNSKYNWSLWQSQEKFRAFERSLASRVTTTSLATPPSRKIFLPPGVIM